MSNYRGNECDCPQNCEEITYSVFESKELLETNDICRKLFNQDSTFNTLIVSAKLTIGNFKKHTSFEVLERKQKLHETVTISHIRN